MCRSYRSQVLDWVGEPYVSTRHAIGGLGLGVFIAQTLLARNGATLQFDNLSTGAQVIVTWATSTNNHAPETRP
jgi:two-component system sensor histidine kinase RegB